jgi:hypothetical protein
MRARSYALLLAGLLVLVYCAGATWISERFVYGENHAARPIGAFLVFYAIGCLGFAGGMVLVWRKAPASLPWIVGVGLVARVLFLPSNLIQENDCYRYVLDGTNLLHGINPYAFSPDELRLHAPPEYQRQLSKPDAMLLHSRIGYKHIATIYPPAAQAVFAVGAWLTPWHWLGQRLVFLACDLATLAVLLALLKRLGKPSAWALFYAWNPLILKEVANAAHLDSLAALCVVLLLWCLVAWRDSSALKWVAAGGLAFACAVLAKLYPLVLGPLLAVYLIRGPRPLKSLALFGVVSSATIVLAYAPFVSVGAAQLTEGLRTYGAEWQRNEGAFGAIRLGLEALDVDDAPPRARQIAGGIVFVVAIALAVYCGWRRNHADGLIAATQGTLLCWFLFLPAAFPWYAIVLLATLALRPKAWGVVLAGVFGMYYLLFLYDYRDYPTAPGWGDWADWTEAAQHLAVWGILLVSLLVAFVRAKLTSKTPEAE